MLGIEFTVDSADWVSEKLLFLLAAKEMAWSRRRVGEAKLRSRRTNQGFNSGQEDVLPTTQPEPAEEKCLYFPFFFSSEVFRESWDPQPKSLMHCKGQKHPGCF